MLLRVDNDPVVRPIRPDDGPRLQAFHGRLSEETIRGRFFGLHPVLTDKEARRFTTLRPSGERALVVIVEDEIIAVGRYVRGASEDAAEVAFVVSDSHHDQGIATFLITRLARLGWADGLRRFVADTFASNGAMLSVFAHTPEAVTVLASRRDGSVVHLVMRITPPPGVERQD